MALPAGNSSNTLSPPIFGLPDDVDAIIANTTSVDKYGVVSRGSHESSANSDGSATNSLAPSDSRLSHISSLWFE